ncbi:DUF4097 family beta strand repeat-containing protein [Streptomyces sp. RLB3-17]|uniref:DUF4097 family beta strand repeat-containing protein n=1 Tax=Streptomyces sp. RLB3-17 TaxID=2594455 RepID=UPI001CEC45DD|nr:DUF4097 family beta strand repeat-containing protein [Streptomyces sp. RLB3-17]
MKVDASADASTISVHRKVNYRGDKPSGTSFRARDGVLVLSGCGKNCGVDYIVKVPAGLPVTGGTSNGDVDVKDVKGGGIDTQTSNGEVTIQTATPQDVTARTTSGNLTVTTPPAKYQIAANDSHGDKNVAFKNDPSGTYRLDLSTTSGDLTVKSAA